MRSGVPIYRRDTRPVPAFPVPVEVLMFCRVAPLTILCCCIGLLVGCSDEVAPEEVPDLHPVSGKVTLDGQPAAGVSISLTQAGGGTGTGGYATTDSSGAYTVQHRSGAPGVPAGEYVVLFTKMAQPDGSPIPPGKTAADVMAENVLPPRYSDTTQTEFKLAVPAGGTTKDFALTSK